MNLSVRSVAEREGGTGAVDKPKSATGDNWGSS